jgi:hypothetical protein
MKLLAALKECGCQVSAFAVFTESLPDLAYQKEWTTMILVWEADKTKPNPYITMATSVFVYH